MIAGERRPDGAMVWEPFVLAVGFGAVISGALWLVFLWPAQEPDDDGDGDG